MRGLLRNRDEGCCNRILGLPQIHGSDQLAGVHPVENKCMTPLKVWVVARMIDRIHT